jgi:hypothetical protein
MIIAFIDSLDIVHCPTFLKPRRLVHCFEPLRLLRPVYFSHCKSHLNHDKAQMVKVKLCLTQLIKHYVKNTYGGVEVYVRRP